ncbi:MAG: cysteine synthase A [Candidatus Omnitrophota bacterium]
MAIIIYLNGKKEEVENNANISKLLEVKKIRPEVVTVELNDKIIERDRYQATLLKPEDRLEFVYYMGGGEMNAKLSKNVLELICNTPMVKLNRIVQSDMAEILAKLESFNPGGSVKDRICLSMIEDAEKKGLLKPGSTIIEPTSGNTGIGLSMVAAVKGYKCILTMPETMSLERIYLLKSYGAEVILTPGIDGMMGSIKKAEELLKKTPNSFMPQQFKNKANPEVHRKTTAKEILEATGGKIDAFVAGVGTGGTITGVGEVLKKQNPDIKIIAVEPKASAVLSGKKPGPHKIQGIGAGFVPDVLNRKVIDEIILIDDNDAFKTSRELAKKEGLLVGISAGAAARAALKVAKDLGKGKTVVVVLPDTGERYFSMEQYFEA